jgi:hypothetical protein
MASLAESIRKLAESKEGKEGMIIIDKKSYASRTNGQECVVTSEESMTNDSASIDIEDGESNYWKQQYEKMFDLNSTAEREFEQYRLAQEQKEAARLNYVKTLEAKISSLSGKTGSNNDSDASEDKNVISFYELMTGMAVSMNAADSATCTVKNASNRKVTRFNMTFDEAYPEVSDLHFEPTGNVQLLPEFLQANLSMGAEHAPELFINILNSLYDETDAAQSPNV